MIREIRARDLLEGKAGRAAADVGAITELLLRVSLLVEEVPEIRALELNPVAVYAHGEGAAVLQAQVRVAPSDSAQPPRSVIAGAAAGG